MVENSLTDVKIKRGMIVTEWLVRDGAIQPKHCLPRNSEDADVNLPPVKLDMSEQRRLFEAQMLLF